LPFPGIADALRPLPHDQYKLTLDINQVIYDGGAIKGAKDLEKADLKVNEMQTETDLYKIKAQVNSLYFNLMLIDRQKELLNTYLETLEKRVASLRSAAENGVALQSDIDIMESEKIRIGQQISENEIRKISLAKVLSDLTGLEIDTAARLVLPAQKADFSNDILRPELQLLDLRKQQINAGLALTQSKRLPKAFGFATFGYGNPP
jgi:outer membrane protein TolC